MDYYGFEGRSYSLPGEGFALMQEAGGVDPAQAMQQREAQAQIQQRIEQAYEAGQQAQKAEQVRQQPRLQQWADNFVRLKKDWKAISGNPDLGIKLFQDRLSSQTPFTRVAVDFPLLHDEEAIQLMQFHIEQAFQKEKDGAKKAKELWDKHILPRIEIARRIDRDKKGKAGDGKFSPEEWRKVEAEWKARFSGKDESDKKAAKLDPEDEMLATAFFLRSFQERYQPKPTPKEAELEKKLQEAQERERQANALVDQMGNMLVEAAEAPDVSDSEIGRSVDGMMPVRPLFIKAVLRPPPYKPTTGEELRKKVEKALPKVKEKMSGTTLGYLGSLLMGLRLWGVTGKVVSWRANRNPDGLMGRFRASHQGKIWYRVLIDGLFDKGKPKLAAPAATAAPTPPPVVPQVSGGRRAKRQAAWRARQPARAPAPSPSPGNGSAAVAPAPAPGPASPAGSSAGWFSRFASWAGGRGWTSVPAIDKSLGGTAGKVAGAAGIATLLVFRSAEAIIKRDPDLQPQRVHPERFRAGTKERAEAERSRAEMQERRDHYQRILNIGEAAVAGLALVALREKMIPIAGTRIALHSVLDSLAVEDTGFEALPWDVASLVFAAGLIAAGSAVAVPAGLALGAVGVANTAAPDWANGWDSDRVVFKDKRYADGKEEFYRDRTGAFYNSRGELLYLADNDGSSIYLAGRDRLVTGDNPRARQFRLADEEGDRMWFQRASTDHRVTRQFDFKIKVKEKDEKTGEMKEVDKVIGKSKSPHEWAAYQAIEVFKKFKGEDNDLVSQGIVTAAGPYKGLPVLVAYAMALRDHKSRLEHGRVPELEAELAKVQKELEPYYQKRQDLVVEFSGGSMTQADFDKLVGELKTRNRALLEKRDGLHKRIARERRFVAARLPKVRSAIKILDDHKKALKNDKDNPIDLAQILKDFESAPAPAAATGSTKSTGGTPVKTTHRSGGARKPKASGGNM